MSGAVVKADHVRHTEIHFGRTNSGRIVLSTLPSRDVSGYSCAQLPPRFRAAPCSFKLSGSHLALCGSEGKFPSPGDVTIALQRHAGVKQPAHAAQQLYQPVSQVVSTSEAGDQRMERVAAALREGKPGAGSEEGSGPGERRSHRIPRGLGQRVIDTGETEASARCMTSSCCSMPQKEPFPKPREEEEEEHIKLETEGFKSGRDEECFRASAMMTCFGSGMSRLVHHRLSVFAAAVGWGLWSSSPVSSNVMHFGPRPPTGRRLVDMCPLHRSALQGPSFSWRRPQAGRTDGDGSPTPESS